MDKKTFEAQMEKYGDACVRFVSTNSGRTKYVVGTTLIHECEYIKEKYARLRKPTEQELEGAVLMFCWDSDSFKLMNTASVTYVEPLRDLL